VLLLRSLPCAKVGVARTCTVCTMYVRITYRLAGHNVSAVLHWAAISVHGTEYGRWPTVAMHTVRFTARVPGITKVEKYKQECKRA